MTSDALALRKALFAALAADARLAGAIGAGQVFDAPPRGARLPYLCFGEWRTRDLSTATEQGAEHFVQLTIWSEQRGAREALSAADRVRDVLDGASLALDGCHLVDLRFQQLDARRDGNGRFTRADLRFRAVTEAN